MPPNAKFTREEIIASALEIVRQKGFKALVARELGAKLGSSARPIFTVFKNMNDVQQETIKAAKSLYNDYIDDGLKEVIAFKGVGEGYIRFAHSEPNLFQLLFMKENEGIVKVSSRLMLIDDNYDKILASVQKAYGLGEQDAHWLYQHLWIYTHGIATLFATKVCTFTNSEIADMITEVCQSLLQKIKKDK